MPFLFTSAHEVGTHGVDGFGQASELGILVCGHLHLGVEVAGGDVGGGCGGRLEGAGEPARQHGGDRGGQDEGDGPDQ